MDDPPDRAHLPPRRPAWRQAASALALTLLLILASAFGFWLLTGTGPFAQIVPSEWALEMTQVSALHEEGLTGAGVVVCLVDTGVDLAHPDLAHVPLLAWRDVVGGRTSPYDDEGHGTAMAGILFARGGAAGVAPGASLIAVKAITSDASGTDLQVSRAVRFCADPDGDGDRGDGAHVISLSLGEASRPFVGTMTEAEVREALGVGIVVVASAGNDGDADNGDVESPASVSLAIAVGAVDRGGVIASFSSGGSNDPFSPVPRLDPNKKPEVVAPGVEIATLVPGAQYGYVTGTSPAAAIVAGIATLLLEAHPEYRGDVTGVRVQALKVAMMEGARMLGDRSEHDDHYGYGLVQALATSSRM